MKAKDAEGDATLKRAAKAHYEIGQEMLERDKQIEFMRRADWQRQHDARREELKEWRAKAGLS
jgi:hypothetical protein